MSVMKQLREARAQWDAKRETLEAIRNGAWGKVNDYRGVELTEEEYCFLKRTYDDYWWMSDDGAVLRRGQRVDDALAAAVMQNPHYKDLDYSGTEVIVEYPTVPHLIWNTFKCPKNIHDKLIACDIQTDAEVDDFCKLHLFLNDICDALPWRRDDLPMLGLESPLHVKNCAGAAYLKLNAKTISDIILFQYFYGKLATKYGDAMRHELGLGKERLEVLGKRDGKIVTDFVISAVSINRYYIVT